MGAEQVIYNSLNMNNIINNILQIDTDLFLMLNGMHNDASDLFAVACSNRFFWIPFYAFLIWKLYQQFKSKVYVTIISCVLLVVCTDQSSRLIKNAIKRLRPCHNNTIQNMVHLYNNDCGGSYGFVSSHAANCAGIATFIILIFGYKNKAIFWSVILYTLLVSYSRIMLGRHYPLDIIGGWLVGILSGLIILQIHKLWMRKLNGLN
jgi:undecaprenyl-diphosphatase